MTPAVASWLVRAALLGALVALGWIAADAFDWWRRRRAARPGRPAAPRPVQLPPRHVRRRHARELVKQVSRGPQ